MKIVHMRLNWAGAYCGKAANCDGYVATTHSEEVTCTNCKRCISSTPSDYLKELEAL